MDLNKIKRFFTHEWQTKLISLLLAAGFWFYVTYFENKTDYNLSIPIRFENLQSDKVIVYSSLKNAFIILPLRRDQKQTVDFNKAIKAKVDLSKAVEGGANFKIELVYDKDLKIKPRLKEDKVNVIIDKKMTKTVPLKEKLTGSPAQGYYVQKVILEETSTLLSGPSQRVEIINFLETQAIDITGVSNTINLKVKINNPENTQLLRKQVLNVTIIVKEMMVEKEIDFPIRIKGLPADLKTAQNYSQKLNMAISGRHLKTLHENIQLSVDCSSIEKAGTYTLRLDVVHPDDINMPRIPANIKIQILDK